MSCLWALQPRESYRPCLPRSSPRRACACLSRTEQSAWSHADVGDFSHDSVQLDQKKGAQLPPLPYHLACPGPSRSHFHDTGTGRTDGSFVLTKAHDSWMWMALCRKRRQVVAYAVGDRSPQDVSTSGGGHSRSLACRSRLHGFLDSGSGGDPRGAARSCRKGNRGNGSSGVVEYHAAAPSGSVCSPDLILCKVGGDA
jgi:hypothetical protein